MASEGGSRKGSGRFFYTHTPAKNRTQFQEHKHTALTYLVRESSELRFSLLQIMILLTVAVTLKRRQCCSVML